MKDENSKTLLVDASFVLSFLLPDEKSDSAKEIFLEYRNGKVNFASSYILNLEVVNGLKSAVKSKRIDKKVALALIKDFLNVDIDYPNVNLAEVFKLAIKEDLSVYDASYVWLSQKTNTPLLSLDKKMQKLAKI